MPIAPWSETASQLVDVAMGRAPADVLITNGRWVNVHSGEIIAGTDIAIKAGRFAAIGPDLAYARGPGTVVIDAHDRYLVPGLCDGHMHVESGMVTVTEFVRAVLPHGTTSMFVDPHEIANVLGLPGIRLMHDEAAAMPTNVFVQMPSCVPAAPGLENAGASIDEHDVAEAMGWPNIIGLGEMMNVPGVVANDKKMLAEIAATQRAGKTVGGHYASLDLGRPFYGYVAGGPADDHEGTRLEDPIARVRLGMRAMLRFGSAWYDVAPQIKAITELGLDSRNFILCTDDRFATTLTTDGHIDDVVRYAIAQGLKPITAIQMASINTASHFGLERELGSITPGRRADLIVTSDLVALPIETVIAHGEVWAEHGKLSREIAPYAYPDFARGTVKVGRRIVPGDFAIAAPEGRNSVTARVIGIIENKTNTRALERVLSVEDGLVLADRNQDVAQVAVVERHKGTGRVVNGFVNGFGYTADCGVAATVAHDSHHMIVVGTNRDDMALAANRLQEVGGGFIVISKGVELALVELPIAGMMSDERAEIVAAKAEKVRLAMVQCGCTLNNALIQHMFVALPTIPELRLTDMGLVDVNAFALTDLFVEPQP
ncbi:MAG: adenine deaminase [Devosia sp.]